MADWVFQHGKPAGQQTDTLTAAALLNSISHDLRTPLVSITGALSSLLDDEAQLPQRERRSLLENAHGEAERLNQLVGNLLDMSRLEAGALTVVREPSDVQDLIGAALEQLGKRIAQRQVTVHVPVDLPLVPLDFVLMVQVLVNLLDNALKYAPAAAPIDVDVQVADQWLELTVADQGPGVAVDEVNHLFDKFYRIPQPQQASGAGLGLSICKGIVEAHGGTIGAANRPMGGAVFTVHLPLKMEE